MDKATGQPDPSRPDLIRLRDRALIAVCLYSFARIEAALGMDVGDYYPQGKRWWFRLHEKGGKRHDMPAHHKAEEYLDAYIEAAGIKDQKNAPLFRAAVGKTKKLGSTQDDAARGPEDDPASGPARGGPDTDLLSQLPGDRDHELPAQRRDAGEGPEDGQPRVGEDDQALRPAGGRSHP